MTKYIRFFSNLYANPNFSLQEMLMERCVLFERCELAAPEERERRLAVGGVKD